MGREKLTLRLEKALIDSAKRHARERGTSVSRMVAGFFESLEQANHAEQRRGPITTRLRGSLKPADSRPTFDEEDYRRRLEEKHG